MSQLQVLIHSKLDQSANFYMILRERKEKLLLRLFISQAQKPSFSSTDLSSWPTVSQSSKVTLLNLWIISELLSSLFQKDVTLLTSSWRYSTSSTQSKMMTLKSSMTWIMPIASNLKSVLMLKTNSLNLLNQMITLVVNHHIKHQLKFNSNNLCIVLGY